MCAVSMILDYGKNHIPIDYWNNSSWHDYKEIIRRLDELDKKLKQPDCHDPAKAVWMAEVEERISKLEGQPKGFRKPSKKFAAVFPK